jgi:hypothetical protein
MIFIKRGYWLYYIPNGIIDKNKIKKVFNIPKAYAIMFDVLEGGVCEPIEWSKENLVPDKIIMVLDESDRIIWLFHGKKRGLVSRRTALRQAQSLKGHGYTIGRSIIGRNMDKIVEIDERKIGRDPETDAENEKFMALLSKTVVKEADHVVRFASAESLDMLSKGQMTGIQKSNKPAVPVKEPVPVSKPITKDTPVSIPKATPVAAKKIDPPPVDSGIDMASEYSEETVSIPPPSAVQLSQGDEVKLGTVLMAVMSQIKDIWASKRDDGSIEVEQIDGPVCKFMIESGKVKFKTGSFNEVDQTTIDAIKTKLSEFNIKFL